MSKATKCDCCGQYFEIDLTEVKYRRPYNDNYTHMDVCSMCIEVLKRTIAERKKKSE